jgi:hypothetical protein
VLSPGQFVVVASNTAQFRARYGQSVNLAGEYAGELNNGGEELLVQAADPYEAAALRFAYDDIWEPTTDGGGFSLVIADASLKPQTWRDELSWTASNFTLGNPGRANIGPNQGSVSIGDVTIDETNTGTVNAVFTVTLFPTSTQTVRVSFTTSDGDATAGQDFSTRTGTLTFLPNSTTRTITVPVLGDVLDEIDEAFFVDLSAPVNTTIDDGRGAVTIIDNDAAGAIRVIDTVAVEGNVGTSQAVFALSLTAISGREVTVSYATTAATAVEGDDFDPVVGVATFAAGATTTSVTVPIVADTVNEPLERFQLVLSNPAGATLLEDRAQATILNDDAGSASWQNARFALDVDDDGFVVPLDALVIINELNKNGSHPLAPPTAQNSPPPFYDVDGDGSVAPLDVQIVLNYLNSIGPGPIPPAPLTLQALSDGGSATDNPLSLRERAGVRAAATDEALSALGTVELSDADLLDQLARGRRSRR